MPFQIFKAGTRRDHHGKLITITADDVAKAAAAYNKDQHEAPIVIGHPTDNAPAFGWVESLSSNDGVLSADFSQMDDDFVDLVKAGRYKKVSASFYPPDSPNNPKPGVWYLRHVGFLGATPPAVKGLAAINFADDDDVVVFSEAAHGYAATLFRNLREFIISKFSLEEADRTIPDWQIANIIATAERDTAFGEPEPMIFPQPETPPEKELDMTPEEQLAAEKAAREKAEAEAQAAKAELKRLQDEQERDLREVAHQKNTDFAEDLVKAGRLKPADKDLVVQALDFAEHPAHYTADFGESKKPLSQALREFLQAVLPQQLPVGEMAKANTVAFSEHMSHDERATALMKAENISYEEAARRTANL